MATTFRAMVVEEQADGSYTRTIRERTVDDLPPGDVLIRVLWSSLNYKDALSATGNKGVTRKYPHTPGIDAAGIVEDSRSSRFRSGDKVLVTAHPNRIAVKHAHSQQNPEKDWGQSTLRAIENMVAKLAGHSAFQGAAAARLKMCGDCRVIDLYSNPDEVRINDL